MRAAKARIVHRLSRALVAAGLLAPAASIASIASLAIAGCGGDDVIKAPPKPSGTPAAAPPPQASDGRSPDGGAPPSATASLPPLPKREFAERDFAESETNRDPFHSYAADLIQQNKKTFVNQRRVLVDGYSLEELKLEGLVIGAPSSVLLVDPTGFGWIAKVGDLVGRPELIHSGGPGGGVDVPVNWRVDRIRPTDVIFVREDPSRPDIPVTTRIMALRPVDENVLAKGQGITVVGRGY